MLRGLSDIQFFLRFLEPFDSLEGFSTTAVVIAISSFSASSRTSALHLVDQSSLHDSSFRELVHPRHLIAELLPAPNDCSVWSICFSARSASFCYLFI